MLLLFVGGVMNLLWVAVLGVVVLAEKLSTGPWLGRIGGGLMMAYGAWLLAMG
jgi:predicted metal-binding membrane protein